MTQIISWTFVQNEAGNLLVGKYKPPQDDSTHETSGPPKVLACFDLDATIIDTVSGSVHALSPTDWKWWHPSVPAKLRSIATENQEIVIFSNQGRLTRVNGTKSTQFPVFKEKFEAICQKLDVKLTIYVACGNDRYRKPRTDMWEVMCRDFGIERWTGAKEISNGCAESKGGPREGQVEAYLVGDAAGRESDHSDADIHFCENLNISFFTPEEFFLGEDTEEVGHKFDPKWHLPVTLGGSLDQETGVELPQKPEKAELLVYVGLPGAGKTTHYWKFHHPVGYERTNEHDLGSLNNCLDNAEQKLLEGKSVVIDDVNATLESRNEWILLAQKHHIQIRAFSFTSPSDLCLHNDSVRALGGPLISKEKRPIFARTSFRKLEESFKPPSVEEGFEEVVDVEFKWSGSEEQLDVWRKHWL